MVAHKLDAAIVRALSKPQPPGRVIPLPRRNKYGAKPTIVDGHRFASKAEAARYGELKLMRNAGQIVHLELQPRFPLVVGGVNLGRYTADFQYFDCTRFLAVVVEDVKGHDTREGKLRRRLAEALHGITVTVIHRGKKR